MNLAIVADWLTTYGGGEHVLAQFKELYPQAPFFTTVANKEALGPLKDADIRTTSLQHLYRLTGNHQVLLSLMPRAVERIDLSGYDVVLSSSHAVGKGIIPPSTALHVCYCHTPIRYGWEMEEQYLNDFNVPHILRGFIKKELSRLRRWDLTTAKRVDVFIANSTTTQERIKRIYGRESIVIAPPVEERFFGASGQLAQSKAEGSPESRVQSSEFSSYFLAVSRLVPYKRIDLLIQVANELQLPLKIAGRGQDEDRLKKLAGPTVELLGFVPDADLPVLYAGAEGFFFPQYEDAGIVALEAQATGTPVLAYNKGGAVDAVVDGKTGILFEEQSVDSIKKALEAFRQKTWNRHAITAHAKAFSETEFKKKIQHCIEASYAAFKQDRTSVRSTY